MDYKFKKKDMKIVENHWEIHKSRRLWVAHNRGQFDDAKIKKDHCEGWLAEIGLYRILCSLYGEENVNQPEIMYIGAKKTKFKHDPDIVVTTPQMNIACKIWRTYKDAWVWEKDALERVKGEANSYFAGGHIDVASGKYILDVFQTFPTVYPFFGEMKKKTLTSKTSLYAEKLDQAGIKRIILESP